MYKNILVPVLFDEKHDTQASFLAAKALADKDASFHVVHVVERVPSYVTVAVSAEIMAEARMQLEGELKRASLGLPGAKTAMIEGHAGRAIVDYADTNGIDCIVMASHRPDMSNILLGSTADRVVRHAKCSVHVIR